VSTEKIAAEKVVSIHYTLTNDDGEVLDSSAGGDPLVYLHGAGNIVPGLERQLEGKGPGEKLEVVVPAVDGYGEREGPGPQSVPRSVFEGVDVEPGMSFVVEDEDGEEMAMWVVEVGDDEVLIDSNHPLAGETLHFSVEVIEVRAATEDELAHGHAHDGHHHH
jgi:FKBP-type peptidyl-prolyl cis-trans isomerase SlyD